MSYNKKNYDELLKAIEAIENNMWKICDLDTNDDDIHCSLCHSFPFDKSLDEVAMTVREWREEIELVWNVKQKREKPVGENIAFYEWSYTGGGIWIAVGQLNSGEWFNIDDMDNGGESFQLFKTMHDAYESYPEDVTECICTDTDRKKFVAMWKEIFAHEQETNGTMSERVPDWKNQLIDMLANA